MCSAQQLCRLNREESTELANAATRASITDVRACSPPCSVVDVEKLRHTKVISAHFPLHDELELRQLSRRWLRQIRCGGRAPIEEIKEYFGEKIGMYFAWLSFTTSMLRWPAIAGIGCFYVELKTHDDQVRRLHNAAGSASYLQHWFSSTPKQCHWQH